MSDLPVIEYAGIVLVDPRGWLLLQERDEHAPVDPEVWSLVGGGLEAGEDVVTCAYRELAEETGVSLAPPALCLWQEFELDHAAYGHLDRLAVFVAATDLGDADIVLGEGRQIVFVDPARLSALPLAMSAAHVLPRLLGSSMYADLCGRMPT